MSISMRRTTRSVLATTCFSATRLRRIDRATWSTVRATFRAGTAPEYCRTKDWVSSLRSSLITNLTSEAADRPSDSELHSSMSPIHVRSV